MVRRFRQPVNAADWLRGVRPPKDRFLVKMSREVRRHWGVWFNAM